MDRESCFMASTDLSDAHYSVLVTISDQKHLMFQFEGQLYKFACLPDGLASARELFTEILKPIFAALNKERNEIMDYLDDFILLGDSILL